MAARKPRRAPARKKRKGASLNPARFLPTHQRYTPALLAHVRQRFEQTPEPMPSMAADLGVAPQSLHRIARRYGWVRRNPVPPPRDVTPALTMLAEAKALELATGASAAVSTDGAASHLSPLAGRGRPPERGDGGRVRGRNREPERVVSPPHPAQSR